MPENLENHAYDVTVVYSKKDSKVHCLKGSDYYKVNFENSKFPNPDLETITISSQGFFHLFHQISPKVVEWPINEVRKWEVKQETIQLN